MTTIGALNKYIHDYTTCINECDFYNTDKTQRLGYDNNLCLFKCNSYFTQLRKNNYPTEKIFFPDKSVLPAPYLTYDKAACDSQPAQSKLACMEKQYQQFICKKQCDLDGRFFTPYRKQICYNLCESQ